MRWYLIVMCLVLCLVEPVVAQPTYSLQLTLLDEWDAPIQVTVTVWDTTGQQLAQGITDTTGSLTVPGLPVTQVRLTFAGTSSAGMPLQNEGQGGMLIFLDAPTTAIFLRVMDTGIVTPDPSEIVLEGVSEPTPLPTAPVAIAVPETLPAVSPMPHSTPAPQATASRSATVSAAQPAQSTTAPPRFVIGLLVVLVGGIGGMLLMRGKL